MARYFFDIHDGELRRDTEGSECNGFERIRDETMHTLSAIAKDGIPEGGDRKAFTVFVRNDQNVTVYTATLTLAGAWLGEEV